MITKFSPLTVGLTLALAGCSTTGRSDMWDWIGKQPILAKVVLVPIAIPLSVIGFVADARLGLSAREADTQKCQDTCHANRYN